MLLPATQPAEPHLLTVLASGFDSDDGGGTAISLSATFDQPTMVLVQDERKWGGDRDRYYGYSVGILSADSRRIGSRSTSRWRLPVWLITAPRMSGSIQRQHCAVLGLWW